MNDLEQRLRTGLNGLADGLPASRAAAAELERRLATRRRAPGRWPATVAAAAVVILAGVATPVLLSRDAGKAPQGQPPTTQRQTPTTSTSATYQPGRRSHLRAGPFRLGAFIQGGDTWAAWGYLEAFVPQTTQGATLSLCVTGVPEGAAVNYPGRHPDSACRPVAPPDPPNGGPPSKVWGASVLGDQGPRPSGPFPGLMLFTTVPEVATLEVGDWAGTPVRVTELARLDQTVLYLADFSPETWAGYRFTAKDAAGNVIASAII